MSNRLPVLAAEIRRAHANVQEAAKTAAQHAIEAGHALIEAKKLVQHGEWLPWLRDHCALAERTAQLYMKIARSGHTPQTVAAVGLKGAERSLVMEYGFHQPLHDGDYDTCREWWLFACFLVKKVGYPPVEAPAHIDWLARHDFKTVAEWLTEGPKWVSRWGKSFPDYREAWATFLADHASVRLDDAMALLADLDMKSATGADLGGGA